MDFHIVLRRMKRSPFFVTGLILALGVLLITFVSPLFVTYNATATSLSERFLAPQGFVNCLSGHVLGTDQLGRDVLTRLLTGGTASLLIAAAAVTLQVLFGTIFGIIAGFVGGIADKITIPVANAVDAYYPQFRNKIHVIPQGFDMSHKYEKERY